MTFLKKIFFCCFLFISVTGAIAQNIDPYKNIIIHLPPTTADSLSPVYVHQINISGNKKTKEYIIRREIQFKKGEPITISRVREELRKARQQIYNTTLFNEVKIETFVTDSNSIDVNVEVRERWYIFPLPQFQPVDRNLNEWLVKYKGDLARVNYGLKFVHYNLSGRRDQLRLYLINGYTRNISFSYTAPNSNKDLTEGFSIGGSFSQTREIGYKTSYNNKVLFFSQGKFVREGWSAGASYIIRKAIKRRHLINLAYTHLAINDSIITSRYNPYYFKDSTASKGYLDLSYTYRYVDVNNIGYPLKGITSYGAVLKRGLGFTGGVNLFSIEGAYNKYSDLTSGWYSSLQAGGRIKFPFDQAYMNQRGLGYGEFYLRGLEYYVVDGVAYGIAKSTLKKKLFSFSWPFFLKKISPRIPFTGFAKAYGDIGYSYTKKKFDTYLNNRFLYTSGIGIDILSFYDLNLAIEYSFNQLGENGLFLHIQGGL